MEGMFDLNNKFRRPTTVKTHNSYMQFELVNLGSEVEPKYVNLGKCFSLEERSKFIPLFKQYKDVFSWTYEDIKTYDTCIIQHVVPIKARLKSFQ